MPMPGVSTLELATPSQQVSGRPMALLIRLCFNSYMEPHFLQMGMNSTLAQYKEEERLVGKVSKSISKLSCDFCSAGATNVFDQTLQVVLFCTVINGSLFPAGGNEL